MKRFSLLALLLVIALTISACSLSVNKEATSAPTVIYVPVTTTPEPTQLPQPTDTFEPLPTIAPPSTATTVAVTPTSDVLHFYVSGYVWHDSCKPFDAVPTAIPAGCLFDPAKGMIADGIFSAGEPGIGNVAVRLEIDCNYGAFTVATDGSGFYKMSFTVPASAGVNEQKICLSIDAASSQNASILLPGAWTAPQTNSTTAVIQLVIPVEKQNSVNFGWDYQFQ